MFQHSFKCFLTLSAISSNKVWTVGSQIICVLILGFQSPASERSFLCGSAVYCSFFAALTVTDALNEQLGFQPLRPKAPPTVLKHSFHWLIMLLGKTKLLKIHHFFLNWSHSNFWSHLCSVSLCSLLLLRLFPVLCLEALVLNGWTTAFTLAGLSSVWVVNLSWI